MEISIQQVARLTGTTSRTLRHYDDIGLLAPSSVGSNGMRYYDQAALTRLQRILLLRELGVGLPAIAEALASRSSDLEALSIHIEWLRAERSRLDRQVAAVDATIRALQEGKDIMAEEMLDGFDHTEYKDEVEQRWGKQAYQRSDRWWRGLGPEGRKAFQDEAKAIADDWAQAREGSLPVDDERVRAVAARHVAWIAAGWGGVEPTSEQIAGLAQMYVDDERFAANYGGIDGATYVRNALVAYVS